MHSSVQRLSFAGRTAGALGWVGWGPASVAGAAARIAVTGGAVREADLRDTTLLIGMYVLPHGMRKMPAAITHLTSLFFFLPPPLARPSSVLAVASTLHSDVAPAGERARLGLCPWPPSCPWPRASWLDGSYANRLKPMRVEGTATEQAVGCPMPEVSDRIYLFDASPTLDR